MTWWEKKIEQVKGVLKWGTKVTEVLLTKHKTPPSTSKPGMITRGKLVKIHYGSVSVSYILYMKNYSICFIINFLIAHFRFLFLKFSSFALFQVVFRNFWQI